MEGEVIDTHLDDGRIITMKVETFKLMINLRRLTVAMNELTALPREGPPACPPVRPHLLLLFWYGTFIRADCCHC
eukprot:SAG11_NODE_12882_length_681_cov_1.039519_1_plen_75_part_10